MQTQLSDDVLAGVGKKLRNGYLAGKVTPGKVLQCYNINKKEAAGFSFFGLTIFDLIKLERETHNPILKSLLQEQIKESKEKSRHSNNQNKISLEKLKHFRENALGIGLHKVVSAMKRFVKKTKDTEAQIILTLLETEFANLSAKKNHSHKDIIYARKDLLLERLAIMLEDSGWRYGINYSTGKNASYIVYVYLPDGVQLSWHCNDYTLMNVFPEIDCTWDGQVCMTMEKILTYISTHYSACLPENGATDLSIGDTVVATPAEPSPAIIEFKPCISLHGYDNSQRIA